MSPARRRQMVDRGHPKLPIVRQCSLLGVTCQGRRHVDGRHSLRVGTIIAIALSIVSTRATVGVFIPRWMNPLRLLGIFQISPYLRLGDSLFSSNAGYTGKNLEFDYVSAYYTQSIAMNA